MYFLLPFLLVRASPEYKTSWRQWKDLLLTSAALDLALSMYVWDKFWHYWKPHLIPPTVNMSSFYVLMHAKALPLLKYCPESSYVYSSNREIHFYAIISSMERLLFRTCTLDFVPSLASVFLTWCFYPGLTRGLDFFFFFFEVTHLELAFPAKNYSAPGSTKSF